MLAVVSPTNTGTDNDWSHAKGYKIDEEVSNNKSSVIVTRNDTTIQKVFQVENICLNIEHMIDLKPHGKVLCF